MAQWLIATVVEAELYKVQSLVKQVNISEGVNMKNNFDQSLQCHLNLCCICEFD